MRKAMMAVGLAALMIVGCNPQPKSVNEVSIDALPAGAMEVLGPAATITKVEQQLFETGQVIYRIHFTAEGRARAIDYNPADETRPFGVFQNTPPDSTSNRR
jgi:hypothetical protein